MNKINNIVEYIDLDNASSEKVFHELSDILKISLRTYPPENNLLAIFFIDFLKLITHLKLKIREINSDVNLKEFSNSNLQSYPYFGYSDIIDGFESQQKTYGKNTALGFSCNGVFSKKSSYIHCVNFIKKFIKKRTSNILFSGESALSTKQHIDVISSHANLYVLTKPHPWFFLPRPDEQFGYFSSRMESMLSSTFNDDRVANNLLNVCMNHAKSSISKLDKSPVLKTNYLVLGSGYELENRMIASIARRQNIPVVNVIHGEGFGIYDEPGFGIFGEQMFSDYLLGYGKAAVESNNDFSFEQNTSLKYIESNADTLIDRYKGSIISTPHSKNINYYYFPTSFRGSQHRFGPFQDLPDSLYIDWQKIMVNIFKGKIITKLHPKEKYSSLFSRVKTKKIKKTFAEIEDEVDIYVFDYIGTAFNQACATNKPVIYFDIGLRNISRHAMTKIKERTVYFNLKIDEIPSLTEIEERIFEMKKVNNLTKNYSLTNTQKIRSQSLLEGLEI